MYTLCYQKFLCLENLKKKKIVQQVLFVVGQTKKHKMTDKNLMGQYSPNIRLYASKISIIQIWVYYSLLPL